MSGWQFNKQINLSMLIQLVLLATLIVGSWVNLQNRLNLLQHDVTRLLETDEEYAQKIDLLSTKNIEYEYRLKLLEKSLLQKETLKKPY